MSKIKHIETKRTPVTLIIGVNSPYNFTKNIDAYFEEFVNLVKSDGVEYNFEQFIKLRKIDPANYFTKGKLNDLIEFCRKNKIERVVISEPMSTQQERNLDKLFGCRIIDRTQLILEIFQKGATSAEGKIQVALAMLQYRKSRLAGRGVFFSQQAGHIGARGPGETQKEKESPAH